MNDELRYGIVGCAGIGNTHADAVRAAEGAGLVACADVVENAARTFADEHDVGEYYGDVATMIEDADIDAVSVCTPSGTHSDVVAEVAAAGADVLCEKPLDVYADDVDAMIEACEDAGVTLAGVFQERFDPDVRRAKHAVAEGELGQPVLGDTTVEWFRPQSYYDSGGWRGTRDMDGGVLMNQAVHSIDTLQWLLGGVTEVAAVSDTLARDLECEDTAAIALRFENGALGTVRATTATKGGADRTKINGTEGTLVLDNRGDGIVEFEVGTGEESRYSAETEPEAVDGDPHPCGSGHHGAVQDFVTALRENRDPEVSAAEARVAVDVILAAYESAETGEWVTVGA